MSAEEIIAKYLQDVPSMNKIQFNLLDKTRLVELIKWLDLIRLF